MVLLNSKRRITKSLVRAEMVSTRGIKLKFFEGERVLCYEPDPTKAKVLYDSKVLEIVINKDQRGKKTVEYLIHFQGWNSSWDRHVSEEYVLKDTPENRQLQKDLAKKSQLQLGAYLYRKERKKTRKITEPEDDNSGSPTRMNNDDGTGDGSTCSSGDDDSSVEEETIHIEITPNLRQILENDHYLIKEKKKLMKLPAEPNIVTILESYYRHYTVGQICGLNEKSTRHRSSIFNYNTQPKPKPEDIQKNLHVCREVLDGLRIYFDYTVNDLLLYNSEKGQIETKFATYETWITDIKNENKTEDDFNGSNNNNNNHQHLNNGHSLQNGNTSKMNPRKRTLRSNRSDSQSHNNEIASLQQNNQGNLVKPGSSSGSSDITGPLSKTLYWKLLPDNVHNQHPPPPCLVYGATHLARLFVKLPELLMASSITEDKLVVLLRHIDSFIDFLNEHKEWFGEEHYVDVLN